MHSSANDLVDAVAGLVARGYSHDFRVNDGQLRDLTAGRPVATADLQVDAALRFESGPDAGDGSNVYAISDKGTGSKGLLIDAFDALDGKGFGELFGRLTADRQTLYGPKDPSPTRYGLRKVFKEEFDEDPERFALRIGFPDFPECPFGQTFSMLGFDTAEQQYVWLVTGIMRDSRLNRIPYQGADVPDNE